MGTVTLNRRHLLQVGAAMAGLGLLSGCGVVSPVAGKSTSLRRVGVLNFGSAPTPSSP